MIAADTVQLKRQHSAEPLSEPAARKQSTANSPVTADSPSSSSVQESTRNDTAASTAPSSASLKPPPLSALGNEVNAESIVGSPFKKQRASIPNIDEPVRSSLKSELLGAARAGTGQKEDADTAKQMNETAAKAFGNWPSAAKDEDEEL